MLALTRKVGEEIVMDLGDRLIVVRVAELSGDKVRLGIEAPRHIPVHRREVYQAIQRGEPQPKLAGPSTPLIPAPLAG